MKKIILFQFLIFTINICYTQTTWLKVECGNEFSIALKSDNTLWSWGGGMDGQLGNNSTSNEIIPKQIGVDNNWLDVAVGEGHCLAIKSDGTLWSWGFNKYGQLGVGDTLNRLSPTQIGVNSDWESISASTYHSCAINNGGQLYSWGYGLYGALGGTSFGKVLFPEQVGLQGDWMKVSSGHKHTLAIKTDSTLWAWGNNPYGQLGDPSIIGGTTDPFQVGTNSDWIEIIAGGLSSYGQRDNNTFWAWGDNYYGQLGDGTTIQRNIPIEIGIGIQWLKLRAGMYNVFAISTDGALFGWGLNWYGSLGIGNATQQNSPVQVGTSYDWNEISAADGVQGHHSIGIKNDLLCSSGLNEFGQLGDSSIVDSEEFNCGNDSDQVGFDVEGNVLSLVSFFPNPTNGILNIRLNSEVGIVDLKIYNSIGKLIISDVSHENEIKLDLSNYPKGIYLVTVESGKVSMTNKIVVQ